MAVDSRTINLEFKGTSISIKLNISSPAGGTTFSAIEPQDDNTLILKFNTPQYSQQTVTHIPAVLNHDFRGLSTLNEDVKKEGIDRGEFKHAGAAPNKSEVARGVLYTWATPSYGSDLYFYLEHPQDRSLALKLGPVGPSGVSLDWNSAQWS
ncbi:hypothetical protein D3C87_1330290 [compost metagenome]